MKTLHCCNIANVAYGYCKILEGFGHDVKLCCHDATHLMSQPEWDDLELDPDDFPEEDNFYNNHADFGAYRRPDWFVSDSLLPGPVKVAARATRILPDSVREVLKRVYYKISGIRHAGSHSFSERVRWLSERSAEYGDEWALSPIEISSYIPFASWLSSHMRDGDLIFAYVLSPIYAMLLGNQPYVSIEIGTMRETPFSDTLEGKLLALAYRVSPHIIITNPDVTADTERLGLENYTFCPHPIDEDIYRPIEEAEKLRLKSEILGVDNPQDVFCTFAPARQNWDIKGNDKYLKAFKMLVDSGTDAVLIIPGWGQEIERSQKLCRDLNLGDAVRWIKPMSELALVKYVNAADCVIDQMNLGVFGLTTPKSLACGVPVVTSYDHDCNRWAFPAPPPILPASEAETAFQQLRLLAKNKDKACTIAEASRKWVLEHHSKDVVHKELLTIMTEVNAQFGR